MIWNSRNFIFHSLMKHKKFCTFDLALSKCHACDYHMPKRSVIVNKVCDNCTPKLNITCVNTCACHRRPFLARLDIIVSLT